MWNSHIYCRGKKTAEKFTKTMKGEKNNVLEIVVKLVRKIGLLAGIHEREKDLFMVWNLFVVLSVHLC